MNTTKSPVTWELPYRSTGVIVVESALFLVNATVAVIGNALVCLAIYRNPGLRSTTNLYITALAVTDMLTALICESLSSGVLITGRWIYGQQICKVQGFLAHYLIYTSVYTMTITAINRYFRMTKPQMYRKIFSFKNSLVIMLGLWAFLAIIVGLPVMAGWASFQFLPDFAGCAWFFHTQAANTGFNVFQSVMCTVIPSVVIVYCYVKVSRTIRAHNANIQDTLQGQNRISVEEIKITKTLYALVVGFGFCWIPSFSIVILVRIFLNHTPHGVAFVTIYLIGLSSAINPFIYGAMNRSFRKEFRKILCCGRVSTVQPAIRIQVQGRHDQDDQRHH